MKNEPEEFIQKMPKPNDVIKVYSDLELQLVVVGTLLIVYWQLLPDILQPITIGPANLTLYLIKLACGISGAIWFGSLLSGVWFLAFPKKEFRKIFDFLFKFSVIFTAWYFLSMMFIYIIFIVSLLLW